MAKVMNRTCKPKWVGNKYISLAGRHFNNELITDEEVIRGLKAGYFSKSDFEVLPEIQEEAPELTEAEQKCIAEFSELKKDGETKKTIVETYAGVEIDGKKVTKKRLSELIDLA